MAKNKVVEANIGQLIPDDKNFNKHTEFGSSLLDKSVTKFGLGRSILLDKNNRIIAGNGITEAAGANGLEDVIIVETTGDRLVAVKRTDIDLDTQEGRELALADNATAAANLDWDIPALQEITAEFDINAQEWGVTEFSTQEEDDDHELSEDGYSPPAEADVKTTIKAGDIFEIRKGDICHRLMCGDSTSLADVFQLMNGKQADLIVTDPPYNVDYAGKNELLNKSDRGNRIQTDIHNDNMNDLQFKTFLEAVYKRFAESCKPGAPQLLRQ